REKISVHAGNYNAIKVDLQLKRIGKHLELEPHRKFRRATIWVSDDTDRLLLRIEAQVFVGTVFAELQSVPFDNPKSETRDAHNLGCRAVWECRLPVSLTSQESIGREPVAEDVHGAVAGKTGPTAPAITGARRASRGPAGPLLEAWSWLDRRAGK